MKDIRCHGSYPSYDTINAQFPAFQTNSGAIIMLSRGRRSDTDAEDTL